jgi:hypothetical protein
MDVIEAVDRLQQAHAAAGLGELCPPGGQTEWALDQIARSVAPLHLPADLLTFWRMVDPDTIKLAPCPRPAGPALSLRLWQRHCAPDPARMGYFPWCYDSHEFLLVELGDGSRAEGAGAGGDRSRAGGDCFGWSGGASPAVRAFPSVAAYLDLLATMIEHGEYVHHTELGVIEFDPARRWPDAQAVRLAAAANGRPAECEHTPTTIAELLAQAADGAAPSGIIRACVVAISGSASGQRIEVTDGSGRLDVWCPASLCTNGPIIERWFEFHVTVRPGGQQLADSADALSGIERATRSGDLRTAVTLATPLYDELFGTPAKAQATRVRPLQ